MPDDKLTDHDMLIRIDQRVANTDRNVTTLVVKVEAGEEAQVVLATRVTRLEERVGLWGALQAVYATIAAAVAGFIGASR